MAAGAVTGSAISNYFTRRQNDTTNTTENTALLQTGWGVITYNTSAANVSESVTFPVAFVGKPIVLISFGGDNGTLQTYGSGGNLVEGIVVAKAHTITNTGFTAHLHKANGTNFAAGFGFYQWSATGA